MRKLRSAGRKTTINGWTVTAERLDACRVRYNENVDPAEKVQEAMPGAPPGAVGDSAGANRLKV